MESNQHDWAGKIMTVNGLLPADTLGVTLPHEHLLVQGWDYRESNYINSISMELDKFTAAGGKTIVDVSSIGQTRDPLFCKKLANRASVHVILGTGCYKEAWLPEEIRSLDVDRLAELMVKEICTGIGESNICAGVIGEIGISRWKSPIEERVLEAAAQAQIITGAGISLHFDISTPLTDYLNILDFLEENGADLQKVAIGNLVSRPDNLPDCQEITRRGCFLQFNMFGQDLRLLSSDIMQTHPEVQISAIRGFIEFGLLEYILLSQNMNHVTLMTVNGGDGYAYLLKKVVPGLKSYGVSDSQIQSMLVENPRRFLAFAQPKTSL